MSPSKIELAVIGAGPAGLALALLAARELPEARITLFDARPLEADVSQDPRTLALSLGSVQILQRLGVWPAAQAQPILSVHVSQQTPTPLPGPFLPRYRDPQVLIEAQRERVPMLGAVLAYGQLVAPMQRAWQDEVARDPGRLASRFGSKVAGVKPLPDGVEVDAGIVERYDLAVIAEGGVFADQARKSVVHDYRQTAWVGQVELRGLPPGMAFERFTSQGPAALLPLGPGRAALVWCVPTDDDPVRELDDAQRIAVLNHVFPPQAGRIVGISPLKAFALGLNAERRLVDGRTVRIGNAAQTLHPVAGQGLNLGLRDAYELVRRLSRDADVDAALRRVEQHRAPDRWGTIAVTDFLARSFTWQWPGVSALRGWGLAALQRLQPAKSLLARQMMFGRR
ncbi:FAD-dependent monooxygenase [Schlegelella aquatica]|uniref:FAD-dependent monooxygenase n=1 Tax=Caldimonas aquatica TaxID=376175 RepID=UPI003752E5C2